MNDTINRIKDLYKRRLDKENFPSIKVNLYKSYELLAVKQAIDLIDSYSDSIKYPECVMVGDSFLMTHLMRNSTKLSTDEGKAIFFEIMLNSLFEVRKSIDSHFPNNKPFLIADLPDGANTSSDKLLKSSELMLKYGADVLKMEISSINDFNDIELLSKNHIPVIAHLGFTPQKTENRSYGNTINEALHLFTLAREARDSGACAIVLERVSEIVNKSLSLYREDALPIYSIFSGKARHGGQSLNVWDSVYKPLESKKMFPPTAKLFSDTYPNTYTMERIRDSFLSLLKLTIEGAFPLSPKTKFSSEEIEYIDSINPWKKDF